MKLDYTKPTAIIEVEAEHGREFFDELAKLEKQPNLKTLLFLFQAGGATAEQFDETFKAGGTSELMVLIMGGLAEAGFLGEKQTIDLDKLRQAAKTELQKNSKAASKNSGKTKKA